MAPNPPLSVLSHLPSRFGLPRMGATAAHDPGQGVTFRIWAPFAEEVAVAGPFNYWSFTTHRLQMEAEGMWALHVPAARPGHEYRFVIRHEGEMILKTDPWARQVNPGTLNGVIHAVS